MLGERSWVMGTLLDLSLLPAWYAMNNSLLPCCLVLESGDKEVKPLQATSQNKPFLFLSCGCLILCGSNEKITKTVGKKC